MFLEEIKEKLHKLLSDEAELFISSEISGKSLNFNFLISKGGYVSSPWRVIVRLRMKSKYFSFQFVCIIFSNGY